MSPKKYLVLAKLETTQFTDATPTAANNSILVSNLNVTPLQVQSEDRNLVRPYFGNSEQIPVSTEAAIEFDVEVQSSGTAGTAPAWGALLQACAWSETVTAGTDVAYSPISSAFKYATIYCYDDGVLYKLLGAAGSLSMTSAAKTIPHFHFKFIGKYTPVTDASIPTTSDFSAFIQPQASLPANMGTVTVGAYAAKVSAFSVDMADEITHAIWMNNETLAPTDRKPKGSLTVEAVQVATNNYFSAVQGATLQTLTVTFGTTAGKIVEFAAPKVQLVNIKRTEFSGATAYQFDLTLNPDAGNDELVITAK